MLLKGTSPDCLASFKWRFKPQGLLVQDQDTVIEGTVLYVFRDAVVAIPDSIRFDNLFPDIPSLPAEAEDHVGQVLDAVVPQGLSASDKAVVGDIFNNEKYPSIDS